MSRLAQQQADAMVDLIFCVDDPEAWHRDNLARHRSHYSAFGACGPRAITAVPERFAKVVSSCAEARTWLTEPGALSTVSDHMV